MFDSTRGLCASDRVKKKNKTKTKQKTKKKKNPGLRFPERRGKRKRKEGTENRKVSLRPGRGEERENSLG